MCEGESGEGKVGRFKASLEGKDQADVFLIVPKWDMCRIGNEIKRRGSEIRKVWDITYLVNHIRQ